MLARPAWQKHASGLSAGGARGRNVARGEGKDDFGGGRLLFLVHFLQNAEFAR